MEEWRVRKHFWANVLEDDDATCWDWYGHVTKNGYGSWNPSAGRRGLAHRTAYEFAIGPIPEGRHVHHTCHNRRCCNPAHLSLKEPGEHAALHHPVKRLCSKGHQRKPDASGKWRCPICRREQAAAAARQRRQNPEYATKRREYARAWAARMRAEDAEAAERERTRSREYQRRKRAERKDA